MKVILLRDVAKLGKRFSIHDLPDGYALNKLIPQGMAQPATPENLKRVQARTKEAAAHKAADETVLRAALSRLAEVRVRIVMEANAQGHLFKAVKVSDVVAEAGKLGISVPESALHIATPIKSVGEHTISVHQDAVTGTFIIEVVAK